MQISLRSQLVAGATAVIGASAVAMTPVAAPALNLPALKVPALSQVALSAFSSPLTQILNTTVFTTNFLFNTTSNPLDATSWAFSGFPGSGEGEQGGLPVLPAALATSAAGGYSSVGLIPQIIDDALPIISQLGYNGSDYLQAVTTELYAAGFYLSQGLWDAVGQLLTLDIQGALDTVIGSVIGAGTALITGAGYVLTGVINRATAVVEAVIGLVPTLLGATLGQISVAAGSVGNVLTNFVDAFGTANPIENAWNAVVDGLLGPSGIPGTLVNLTLGAGVQTGPITSVDPADIAANFVPSIRTEIQAGVKVIADALATPVSAAPPAAAAVEAPAAVEAAPAADEAVAAAAEAPAAEAAAPEAAASDDAAEAVAAAGASEAAEAPAAPTTRAVTRGAAAKAADSDSAAGTPKRAARGAAKRAAASAE